MLVSVTFYFMSVASFGSSKAEIYWFVYWRSLLKLIFTLRLFISFPFTNDHLLLLKDFKQDFVLPYFSSSDILAF